MTETTEPQPAAKPVHHLNWIMKVCQTCNKNYEVKPSQAPKSTYCSRLCMAEGYSTRLTGDNNPKWRGGFKDGNVEVSCFTCGKTFRAFESRVKINNTQYCSKDCYNIKLRANKIVKEKPAPKEKRIRLCPVCNQEIKKKEWRFCSTECHNIALPPRKMRRCALCFAVFKPTSKWQGTKYCSIECKGKGQSLRQLGPNSHLWQGGKTNRTMHIRNHPLYTEWRKKVFERDKFTCQSCFRSSLELKSGKLTAHHHVLFSDDIRLRFKVSNGITLCWQCHKDYHRFVRNGSLATLESDLMKDAQDFFSSEPGVFFFKVHGELYQERGIPDFIGSVAGRAVAIELKIFPNYVTQVQHHQIRRIREAGGAVFVCRSLDEVKRVVYIVKEAANEDGD